MKRTARLVLVVVVTASATVAGVRLLGDEPAPVDRGPVYPASWDLPQTPKPLPTDVVPVPDPATPSPTCTPRPVERFRAWVEGTAPACPTTTDDAGAGWSR